MFDFPVVIVDIETTGASTRNSKIIEIAAIKVQDNQIVDTFETLVNPGIRIPNFITALTSIDEKTIRPAPKFSEVAERLYRFLEGAVFIAHNVNFDYSFIKKELSEHGISYNAKTLCSVRISRYLYPRQRKHSLESIIQKHGIHVDSRHRAMQDARAVYDFLLIAKRNKEQEFINCIKYYVKNTSVPQMLSYDVQAAPAKPGVYIFKDTKGNPIYIGKSNNIQNRIKSHFSAAKTTLKENKISEKTQSIETIETGSEIEALLLESRLVKQYLPVHNVRLRRKKEIVIALGDFNSSGYLEIKAQNCSPSSIIDKNNIYGIFNTRTQFKKYLSYAIEEFELCSKLLSQEKCKDACFRYQLGKCNGACIGKEPIDRYNLRAFDAFEQMKFENWNYGGLVEVEVSKYRKLVVDNWRVVATIDSQDKEQYSIIEDTYFDLDAYKIMKSYFALHPEKIKHANAVV